MKSKIKKYEVITGLCAVCLLMIVMIGARFQTDKPEDDPIPTQGDISINAPVVDPSGSNESDNGTGTEEVKPDIVINPVRNDNVQEGQAVYTGTEQTIQADVTKPDPSEEQLSDPTKTPDGVKIDTPPQEELKDKNKKPSDTPQAAADKQQTDPKQPQGGEKKDGKIYIPGFGWVEDQGGGGQGVKDDEMYENGNKVGVMG